MGEVRITDEMVEAARAKGRELAGNQPGALVEAMAEIAEQGARAALSAALSGMAEPVAFAEKDGEDWITYWPETGGTFEHIRDYPHLHQPNGPMPLFTAPPASGLREENRWQPIETALKDGTEILAWFPCLKLDEDGDLTDQPVDEEPFGGRAIVSWEGGCWREPDWLSASGDFFGDDFEYASEPTLWQPLPAPPALQPEGK